MYSDTTAYHSRQKDDWSTMHVMAATQSDSQAACAQLAAYAATAMFTTSETAHQLCGYNQNEWHGRFAKDDHEAEQLY